MLFTLLFLGSYVLQAQRKEEFEVVSIGFYNLENLYDFHDDPNTFDDDRAPSGKDRWTQDLYQKKLNNMAYAISEIGKEFTGRPPDILGVCEIENLQVLEDLVKNPFLKPYNYGIVHFDSPDRRGIDVALLYRREIFSPKQVSRHELVLFEPKEPTKRSFTRDQLLVSGSMAGDQVHFLINHWPSRSGGEKLSSHRRENAAKLNRKIVDSLNRIDPYARIMIMGDFNDDPHNTSLTKILGVKSRKEQLLLKDLYNPYANLARRGAGSLAYRDQWNLFDQIILSTPLVEKDPSKFSFFKAYIFNEPFLTTPTGQYKGYPFRSFGSTGFTGGYSDHFPVYVLLIKKK
ncbi:endonuclease/exonuclease/phosphatase family protein [Salinimicrobium sp. CDJ15-91]|uniref:Endonuclease/exonuclease/phosphatase family protein n=1 Tax=Salinimicrobium oceani TaxID=2722702 RepID=A0ABX1D2I9_9FLAO|nr:endonuclease/exonuclease/phosphatase family protein [Salinimicrobium oceani]